MRLAHQFAVENELVTADMVEASEFPHLSQRYGVRAVPMTIVNDRDTIEGGLPEPMFIEEVLAAASNS